MSFQICLNWFVLFKFSIIRFVMSWICDEFSAWVCFGLNQGREKESRPERESGAQRKE